MLGNQVGDCEGINVGGVGELVGTVEVGDQLGLPDGELDGAFVGSVGLSVGKVVGRLEGLTVGLAVGR